MKKIIFISTLLAGALIIVSIAAFTRKGTENISVSDHPTPGPFTPPLTPLGAQIAQQGPRERRERAERLLQGFENAQTYNTGICYEVVAFVRFLFDGVITCDDLTNFRTQGWLMRFNFDQGRQWDGNFALRAGEIIGFRNAQTGAWFHAALATGNNDEVRSVNGGRLGAGWNQPALLKTVLGARNYDGTFNYDGFKINVFISNL